MKTINYIYIILIINEYITSNQSAFLLIISILQYIYYSKNSKIPHYILILILINICILSANFIDFPNQHNHGVGLAFWKKRY